MLSGHFFNRIGRGDGADAALAATGDGLVARLTTHVAKRFGRVCDLHAIVVPPECMHADETGDCPCSPTHPDCAAFANSAYCRESWLLHLAQLADHPETHWHHCDHRNLCGVVPVTCEGRCIAAVRVVCPDSMNEDDFQHQVELLDLVVWNFERAEADLLKQLVPPLKTEPPAASAADATPQPQPEHPHVRDAIQIIDKRLADPRLSVEFIAREIHVHPNYLGHLFAEQVGVRMSRYIPARRVDRAKELLVSTDDQVKKIARACGFANPNWFCHVFSTHTGLAPIAYREQGRSTAQGR